MHFKTLGRIFGFAVALVAVSWAGDALAMQMSPAQKQQMMEHYERATRAYDIQKYPEAIEEYQKAYEVGGDPAMLYNVAQAYRLNDQLTEALHAYRRYLQRSPTARNREDVERKIADLEQAIEARRKASAAAEEAVRRGAPPPATVPVAPPPAEAPTPPAGTTTNGMRIAGITVLSVGAAGLVTAGISGLIARKKGEDLTQASMDGAHFDPSIQSSGKTWNTVAIATVIGGGVLAVAGTILLVASSGDESQGTKTARLVPVLGGGGAGGSVWGMGAAITF